MAAVPLLLRRRQLPGNHELEPGVLPRAEAALEGGDVLESHLRQGLCRKRRAIP